MLRNFLPVVDKLSTTELNKPPVPPEALPSGAVVLSAVPTTEKVISEALLTIRQEQIIHRRFDQLVNMSHEVLQSVIAKSPRDIEIGIIICKEIKKIRYLR